MKVAVSYSWKEEREGVGAESVRKFCETMARKDIEVIRDCDRLRHGQCISEFMRDVGASDCLCVFLSDGYLRSRNCMYELLVAWQTNIDNPNRFRRRVKIWVMQSASSIYQPEGRLAYKEYWHSERSRLERLRKASLQSEVDHYKKIELYCNEILALLADTLSFQSLDQFEESVLTLQSNGASQELAQERSQATRPSRTETIGPLRTPCDASSIPVSNLSLPQLRVACERASKALLQWPRGIGEERIESPVLPTLLAACAPEAPNVKLLLGEPGSGKSALLSQVAHIFTDQGAVVLGIKADLMQKSVASVESLGQAIGLGERPVDGLQLLAEQSSVIVLVDQLDALADLVDVHGGRLNALLQFIRELADHNNIQVIASCREFEFRHDARLSSLQAEVVHLPLLEWKDVAGLLQKRGVVAANWSETFREILRRPQHLGVFVQFLKSGQEAPVFGSYHQMLERLWSEKVTNADGLAGRASLLLDLAQKMAEVEDLWLARGRFDDQAPQLEQLLKAGMLTTAADERTIGFQHQTIFDFALARSFLQEGASLTDFVLARQQSLFVRPRLWNALVYLRAAERKRYHREIKTLLARQDLRLHLRLQLIEFLAHLEDPDQQEETMLRSALGDPSLRFTALTGIAGRRRWFELLASDLIPEFMSDSSLVATLANILKAEGRVNGEAVLALLRQEWGDSPDRDWWTMSVLTLLCPWNEDARWLAEKLASRSSGLDYQLFELIEILSHSDPSAGVRIFAAYLKRSIEEIEGLSSELESTGKGGVARMFDVSPRQRQANQLLEGRDDYPDLKPLAEAAPAAFLTHLWPLFLRLLSQMNREPDFSQESDDFAHELGLGLDMLAGTAPLMDAIETAAATLATSVPDAFLEFVETNNDRNSLTVQRLLARILARVAALFPDFGLSFILSDPRRFKLGHYSSEHQDTGALINALCPHLDKDQIRRLENAIKSWNPWRQPPPDLQPDRLDRWARKDRLRLLKCIPKRFRSAEIAKLVAQEEKAFPTISQEPEFARPTLRDIGSPMSVETMETASDEEILETVKELPDSTQAEHPTDFFKGGSIQFSRAFGEFAKRQPERVIRLLRQLNPAEYARPAVSAVEKLAESSLGDQEFYDFVVELDQLGFLNREFRDAAADAVRVRLGKGKLPPDAIIRMFEQWLADRAAEVLPEEPRRKKADEESGSFLWRSGYSWGVPGGSYPVLRALTAACYVAKDFDKLLEITRTHLERPERSATWEALCFHLDWLQNAKPGDAATFLTELFKRYPTVRDSLAGITAIARAFVWLPCETARELLESVWHSAWSSSGRAYGELVMYRHTHWPDAYTTERINDLLHCTETPKEVLAGVAASAVHAYQEPEKRAEAGRVLLALIPIAEETTALEILGLFNLITKLEPQAEMLAILRALVENPTALVPSELWPLLERLPDLIPAHSTLVSMLVNTILDHHSVSFLDTRTRLAASTGELINIALTLHRDEGSGRELGLTLFERLLSLNIYGTRESLFMVDARPVPGHLPPRRRNRRRFRARNRLSLRDYPGLGEAPFP